MKAPRFDRHAEYSEIFGAPPEMRGARYLQAGHMFRRDGSWVVPDDVDPATIEFELVEPPPADEAQAVVPEAPLSEQDQRALCQAYAVAWTPGLTMDQIVAKSLGR